jgi:hypothetical protein
VKNGAERPLLLSDKHEDQELKIDIPLPSIQDQQALIFKAAIKAGIKQLQANLEAPVLPAQVSLDEGLCDRSHLLRVEEGWQAPSKDLLDAYFKHFQKVFPEYGTDAKLAKLLGLSSDRRVREYKQGRSKIPYGVWRRFLILTGRVPQDIIPVLAFMA